MMNIFYFDSERNLGGVERWMFTSGSHLKNRGHRVYFGGRPQSLFLQRCESMGLPVFPVAIGGDFNPRTILTLARLFRRLNIHVIVTNLNKDTRLAGIARKLAGRNVLVGRNGLPILKNNRIYRHTYTRLASGIIMPNHEIKQHYLGFGWLPEDFMRVIHNGISGELPIDYDHAATRGELGIPAAAPVTGIFGRLVPQKQHRQFLLVAQRILQQRPESHFLIVGDGPLREAIGTQAQELGILPRIHMPGFQKEVMRYYTLCEVVVQTSDHEGLPNVVLEAMFAGKPVVSFDVGGTREMITDPAVGIVLPHRDVASMAAAVLRLLDNPAERRAIGSAARARILENFSVERMVNNVERFFSDLLQRHHIDPTV